jgi:hypothetical protein
VAKQWIKAVIQDIGDEVHVLHTGDKSSNANNVVVAQ